MQTNIAAASGKVNYFDADLILTNDRVACEPSLKLYGPMRANTTRRGIVFTISGTIDGGCDIRGFTNKDYAPRPASWRRDAKW
jgi:hypothetical protein